MSNRFDELKNLLMSLEADFKKFYEQNNKAAGTRVRKGMLDLKNLAQDIRLNVQDIKNTEENKEEKPKPKAPAKKK
jgi:hypothetical protein